MEPCGTAHTSLSVEVEIFKFDSKILIIWVKPLESSIRQSHPVSEPFADPLF